MSTTGTEPGSMARGESDRGTASAAGGQASPRRAGALWWSALAIGAASGGVACLAVLLWALGARLDRWEVQPFVLLIYGAAASAVVSSLGAWRGRRVRAPGLSETGALRGLLWVAVLLILAWTWFPPTEHLVGWWIRQVSMFRFR